MFRYFMAKGRVGPKLAKRLALLFSMGAAQVLNGGEESNKLS